MIIGYNERRQYLDFTLFVQKPKACVLAMKRDWDLIRQILFTLELRFDPAEGLDPSPTQFPGYDTETINAHMRLLVQAGLIEAHPDTPLFCVARNLTWAGHELLDLIRDDSDWNRIGTLAREKGLNLSFETITQIGRHLVSSLLGS